MVYIEVRTWGISRVVEALVILLSIKLWADWEFMILVVNPSCSCIVALFSLFILVYIYIHVLYICNGFLWCFHFNEKIVKIVCRFLNDLFFFSVEKNFVLLLILQRFFINNYQIIIIVEKLFKILFH